MFSEELRALEESGAAGVRWTRGRCGRGKERETASKRFQLEVLTILMTLPVALCAEAFVALWVSATIGLGMALHVLFHVARAREECVAVFALQFVS